MSYDVSLQIDTGGPEPARVSPDRASATYNWSPLFRLALGGDGVNDLGGLTGAEATDKLRAAIMHISAPWNWTTYLETNDSLPPQRTRNNMGDLKGAMQFLEDILEDCIAHPKATIRVG